MVDCSPKLTGGTVATHGRHCAGQTAPVTYELTGTGIWNAALRYGDHAAAADAAAELESLGYSAIWLPDVGGDLFPAVENLLGATRSMTVATGILNLWMHTPAETAQAYTRLTGAHGRRFLVGIGVSHGLLIDMLKPGEYQRPLAKTESYLDDLDRESPTVPADDRVLAALGPKMLALARTKAAGTHPYNVVRGAHRRRPRGARSWEARRPRTGGRARDRSGEGPRHRPIVPRHLPGPARTTPTTGSATA